MSDKRLMMNIVGESPDNYSFAISCGDINDPENWIASIPVYILREDAKISIMYGVNITLFKAEGRLITIDTINDYIGKNVSRVISIPSEGSLITPNTLRKVEAIVVVPSKFQYTGMIQNCLEPPVMSFRGLFNTCINSRDGKMYADIFPISDADVKIKQRKKCTKIKISGAKPKFTDDDIPFGWEYAHPTDIGNDKTEED